MTEPMYLGLDVGTQSVKGVLLARDGRVSAVASAALRMLPARAPGHSEQDPAEWQLAVSSVCRQLAASSPRALATVTALGVSGQQHGFVPVDADGRVIRPAKLWNDVSSACECAAIVAALGGAGALFARTGNGLPPGFTAGKIRWLREHEPEHFARLELVLLPHDWIDFWLTGRAWCEAGDASGTGLFDVRARRFSTAVCDAVAPGLAAMLPPLLEPGAIGGCVRGDVARELGLPDGVAVSTGGGDNMMAAIGAGAVRPGIAVLSLGTSGTVFACAEQPVCDEHGEIAAFCDSTGRWLPLGCTMNATVATELVRAALGLDLAGLEAAVSSAPAGSDGVLCVPYFTGERSPDLPDATGTYLGLRPDNCSARHLARATVEGATFALCRLLDRLGELGVELREVRLTGGGSQSATWRSVVASACDVPVTAGVHADSAALGAAIHALWTDRRRREPDLDLATCRDELGLDRGLHEVRADSAARAVYRQRRREWEACVATLAPLFGRLRDR